MKEQPHEIPTIQRFISILWPSFLTAGLATAIFFTVFDPTLIVAISGYGEISHLGGYTIGFFLFWLLTSTSSALSCYFLRPCVDVSRRQDKQQRSLKDEVKKLNAVLNDDINDHRPRMGN